MKRVFTLFIAAIAYIAYQSPVFAASIPDAVKDVVRNRVDGGLSPSIVVVLFDATGTDFFAYGKTSLDAAGTTPDENTIYEIGSISKVFTATLLVDAKNRGEVALDDPISKYLPKEVKAPQRDGKSITLANLSTQNSGLPRMPNNFRPKDSGNPFADYTPELLYEFLSKYELTRGVGEKFEYSNLGVGLLGHLLERATGKPYEQLVIERIANVLGMPDTRITLTDNMKKHLALPYANGALVKNWDIPTLAGAGAIRSSAKDMVTFIKANLGLVDSPLRAAMEEAHRVRADTDIPDARIGFGWITRSPAKGPAVTWHNGGTGGYRTFAGFAAESKTGAVVLCNSGGKGNDDIGFHLLNDSIPMENTVKRTEVKLPESTLRLYEGKYQMGLLGVMRVDFRRDHLMTQLADQPAIQIYPESETDFFCKDVDAQITFKKDKDGKATEFVLHQNGADITAKRIE